MEAVAVTIEKKKPVRKIPEALVYEIMDGQPYYRKLLDFGVEKVIWILTDTKQVILAERNAPSGQFMDWDRDVEIRPGLIFNIGHYLEKRGIVVE